MGDIALIEEMQRKQKEAKLLYTGIPEHLIPADMKRFVEKPKTGGGWQDRLTDNMNAILGDQGSEKKSKKVMTDNQKLFYRHSLKHTDSSLPEYQRREMEEFSNYKTKKFLGILPHWKRLWNYSIREKDDRKIFGIIKQKGSSTLEQEHMQELKDSYEKGDNIDSKEESIESEMALAQQPEIEEKTTYYKINLDQIYRESTESENDWIDKDRQGIKALL